MRQSVSDPKWWENLSPVTCNRFVTPRVALPLHLSPDLRRFPPNSGALEAVKLLHTSAAVHSHNLPIISLPAILHKAQGNAYIWLFYYKFTNRKKKGNPKRLTAKRGFSKYSIAERNATSKNVIKHTLHKWRVISQQLVWLLEPPKLGLLGFIPVADAQNVFCPVQRLGRAIEACFTGTSQSQS